MKEFKLIACNNGTRWAFKSNDMANGKIYKTEEEWKKIMTREQYLVMRCGRMEKAFTGKYLRTDEKGVYHCAACGNPLFSSDTKFDSNLGWPSFSWTLHHHSIRKKMITESKAGVFCSVCLGFLGYVFREEKSPTKKIFLISSAALDFFENSDSSSI